MKTYEELAKAFEIITVLFVAIAGLVTATLPFISCILVSGSVAFAIYSGIVTVIEACLLIAEVITIKKIDKVLDSQ